MGVTGVGMLDWELARTLSSTHAVTMRLARGVPVLTVTKATVEAKCYRFKFKLFICSSRSRLCPFYFPND